MSTFSESLMDWEYEGHQFEVQYTITSGHPGSGCGDPNGQTQPEPDEVSVEFFLDEADVPAEQAAVLVARMDALFADDEAFRLALEEKCLDHAQGVSERRDEERMSR